MYVNTRRTYMNAYDCYHCTMTHINVLVTDIDAILTSTRKNKVIRGTFYCDVEMRKEYVHEQLSLINHEIAQKFRFQT